MWRVAVMGVTTAIGYAVGNSFDSAGLGSLIGFVVGLVISFPEAIGSVAEGVVDCID